MRTVVAASRSEAQHAGRALLDEGGGAVDAVVGAMLAGATVASRCALLGSGVVLVAGTGAAAFCVEGFARAPGRGLRRRARSADPPPSWRAVVPGLLVGALSAQARFGTLPLATIVRAAVTAAGEQNTAADTSARIDVLASVARLGLEGLHRLGVVQAMREVAGVAAGGVLTRADLTVHRPAVKSLATRALADHDVRFVARPAVPPSRRAPPPLPSVPMAGAAAIDHLGVVAIAMWVLPPEALDLGHETGLALPALGVAPRPGVPRHAPGGALAMEVPAAIVESEGRAWAGIFVEGQGELVGVRDRALALRLAPGAKGFAVAAESPPLTWVWRDANDEAHASHSSHGGRA